MRAGVLVAICLATFGCSEKADQHDEETQAKLDHHEQLRIALQAPQYGPVQTIQGQGQLGSETSMIAVCKGERTNCEVPRRVDGSEETCWLEFGEAASAALAKLTGTGNWHGEFWVVGRGRIAIHPRNFGHLGGYTCQVELQNIQAFDDGPPWIWQPPPPAS